MPAIFEDERREIGPVWPVPEATRPIFPLDAVANDLKWTTLPRQSRLASEKMAHAGAATYSVNGS